jgi:hypothetical protein
VEENKQGKMEEAIVGVDNNKDNKTLPFKFKCDFRSYRNRLSALVTKNVILTYRQLTWIFALLLFPSIQLWACSWAVGGDPWGLKFGIVNHELKQLQLQYGQDTNQTLIECGSNRTCEDFMLGCDFVEEMESSPTFSIRHFESDADALAGVKAGDVWGFISIPPNFTQLSMEKALAGLYADQDTVDNSRIDLELDMTNVYASATIRRELYGAAGRLMKNRIQECEQGYVAEIVDGPIRFDGPIYGKENQALTHYMSTGVLLMYG